jgi:uncharacterized protein
MGNCTSFSAASKVEAETSGPTAGAVPNAGGAPAGNAALGPAGGVAGFLSQAALAAINAAVALRKWRRDFDMPHCSGPDCGSWQIPLFIDEIWVYGWARKGIRSMRKHFGPKHLGVVLICALSAGAWAAVPPDLSAGVKSYESGDYAAALRVFKPAAQKGNAEAQFDLGVMYQRGHGVGKDTEEAFKWLRASADQGLPQAQFLVGQMREKGEGIAPDYAEAQRWYQMAANSGDPDAANGLAALYEEGFGVSKDVSRAAHWYRLAADQGLPEAQFRLALLLEMGQGVTKNDEEATRWYTRAAEQGNGFAESRLGSLYLQGKGVPQDNLKAYFWLTLATKQDRRYAERQRALLITKLTPDQVTKTEIDAAHFKAKISPSKNVNTIH